MKVVVEEWTHTDRDGVDVGFKLRSPLKIAFDMNARKLNKKIKIGITLELL